MRVIKWATHRRKTQRCAPLPLRRRTAAPVWSLKPTCDIFRNYENIHTRVFRSSLLGFKTTHRLHGSSCDDDRPALLQHLGEVDRRIQQQELDAALRQSACTPLRARLRFIGFIYPTTGEIRLWQQLEIFAKKIIRKLCIKLNRK